MKKILALLSILFLTAPQVNCKTPAISSKVISSDGIEIAFNQYQTNHDTVLIIAPGWFMTKDANAFQQLSEDFAKYYDVITFDFRGHSKSKGKYTFGCEETKDLAAVVDYAKENYKTVYLMGFSLGSLISIDYCSQNKDIDKLIVVSTPVNFKSIENNVLSPNAFIPTLKKFEFKRWTSIRFEFLKKEKPEPIKIIDKVSPIPIFLIAGEKDPIIKVWHNEALFKKAKNDKQEYIFKNGKHAEDIYLENKEEFIKRCMNWLNIQETVFNKHKIY